MKTKNQYHLIICLLLLVLGSPVIAQVKAITVSSPDGSILFSFSIHGNHPEYSITKNGKKVINPSALGLMINEKQVGQANLFTIIGRKSINETYTSRGIHSTAINKYNALKFKLNGPNPYEIEVKVFNDGAAFRYLVDNKGDADINSDQTSFEIPLGSTIWSQSDINSYEGEYHQQKIEEVVKGQLAGPPLTIQLPGTTGYAAITEGGLTDFAGMSLISSGNQTFVANLTGTTHKNGAIETPWRIILIGATLNQLVNSDVIGNVSPKPDAVLFPKGYATDWIRPGKSVWSWLAANGNVTFENMKRFSDWAAELGIDYNLVDEGWAKWHAAGKDKWEMMKELVDYSNKEHVKVWVWKAYPDRDGDPGIKDAARRMAFFKKCAEVGIKGLKIDFFDTESQEVIDFYQAALKDAATLHLMLDFHGADKPTGQSRTWPNELSREGIRGLENTTSWPKHNTTLLFTRFLAGHADYTPLSFTDIVKGTTLAHQVATVGAFTSEFMCLGVNPEVLLTSQVKMMVKQIPVVWDETIILPQSKIGELVVMARRSGRNWFLIALNGDKAKSLTLNPAFLGKGNYYGNLLLDDETDPEKVWTKTGSFNSTTPITLTLLPGGGFIGRFYN